MCRNEKSECRKSELCVRPLPTRANGQPLQQRVRGMQGMEKIEEIQ